jgi:hypothetical protein
MSTIRIQHTDTANGIWGYFRDKKVASVCELSIEQSGRAASGEISFIQVDYDPFGDIDLNCFIPKFDVVTIHRDTEIKISNLQIEVDPVGICKGTFYLYDADSITFRRLDINEKASIRSKQRHSDPA